MRRTGSARGNIGRYAVVLAIAVSLNFALPRLMPGNPVALIAGVEPTDLSPGDQERILAEAGLDQPILMQYLTYWGDVLTLDLGHSFRQNRPILEMILERLPWTLLLALTSLLIGALIGMALGAFAAWRRGRPTDITLLAVMIALDSTPAFWLGMLLVAFFAVQLGWFPTFGAVTPGTDIEGWALVSDIAAHAVLPVVTLTVLSVPGIFLTMRYSTLSVLGEEFVRTARSKGLRENAILARHVVRNAILPVVTVIALRLGYAFGGTVVVETVFSYPGLGRLVFDAVSARDYPVMQSAFLVFTVAVLAANALADFIYPRLDPRTRTAS